MMGLALQLLIFNSVAGQSVGGTDMDHDGIGDTLEQTLAEKFAPVIYHDKDERHLPTNVDQFLKCTKLYFYDNACSPDVKRLMKKSPAQRDLLTVQMDETFCNSSGTVQSNCTRSNRKQRTFYLSDVLERDKAGCADTKEWTTYFHCYKNVQGGATVQYWRFFASDVYHGGDWECVQVFLDSNLRPLFIDLLGHTSISRYQWNAIKSDGNHVKIFSVKGGHTSVPYSNQNGIKQETWSGGKVYRTDGTITESGTLLNLGEKLHPLNGQWFIQYSGLWGSPGIFYFTSGYWGPCYNETGMEEISVFMRAWCNGMVDSDGKSENGLKECYPCDVSR